MPPCAWQSIRSNSRLHMVEPPKPGETSASNVNVGRDLVDALGNLLQSENLFLAAWVDYEAQRQNLDFTLGLMPSTNAGCG